MPAQHRNRMYQRHLVATSTSGTTKQLLTRDAEGEAPASRVDAVNRGPKDCYYCSQDDETWNLLRAGETVSWSGALFWMRTKTLLVGDTANIDCDCWE